MSSDWLLEELGIIVTGKTPPQALEKAYFVLGTPFLTPKDMDGRKWITSTERYLSEAGLSSVKNSLIPAGSISVSCIGSDMGKAVMVPVDTVTNQQINSIIPDKTKCHPEYLYYLLSTKQQELKDIAGGSATPILNKGHFGKIQVHLPDIGYQAAAAKILSSFDDKIQLNNQINQTLEQMAQAIFKSWFVDFEPVKTKIAALEAGGSEDDALLAAMQAIAGSALFATDAADTDAQTQLARLQADHPEQYATLRATAELFPSAMQESELGEIPAGWKVLPLSEMVELIGGGTPKRSEPAYWNGDICWFSVKDTPNDGNVFVIDTVEKITDAGLKGSSTKLLPLGTTIITARGTVGKLALTGVVTAMNQSCYGVIGIDGTGPYLNYLQMQEAVETLQRNTHGAVFDTITQATFGTVFQAQACISLRTNFENLVAPAFEMIKNNLQQIKALSELRDTLLPKLLSGELSVAEAE